MSPNGRRVLSPDQDIGRLSGGERTKIYLAGITLHRPGIILLDEPSNHLDQQGRRQLYELVEQSKATMLVVSHDRKLLNLLPETIELSKFGLERFGGNYDFYSSRKQQDIQALESRIHEQAKGRNKLKRKPGICRNSAPGRNPAARPGGQRFPTPHSCRPA